MSKWSVAIHQSHHNGSKNPKCKWVVDPPGYNHKNRNWGDYRWHVAGGKWFAWGRGVSKREAWEKALAYADRRARTREYVLPRQPLPLSLPGIEVTTVEYDEDGDVLITDHDGGEMVAFYKHELRPLALALLAHAERIGE